MDAEKLAELAQDVMDLLKQHGIPAEIFTLSVLVPRDYFDSIKENFPDRHPVNRMVGAAAEKWSIDFLIPLVVGRMIPPTDEQHQ